MIKRRPLPSYAALCSLALAGCAAGAPPGAPPPLPAAQAKFWDALQSHCGQTGGGRAYAGALASEDARDADWRGRAMVAHWARCSEVSVAVAFHVENADRSGWDRSRTWVVTRRADGLRLKHDHRHADGSADAVTQYGGDTLSAGTGRGQDFPVDDYSIALFGREGLAASLTNVWRVEVDPADEAGAKFAYQLTRRNDPTRRFRVEFDLTQPVAAPESAWGW